MSTQCNRFVQNAWKKELCSNCFKSREEHASLEEVSRVNVGRTGTSSPKIENLKRQGILRGRAVCEKDSRKKNVAFPESLTQIIGYGGDDFHYEGEEDDEQDYSESFNVDDDLVPDSEEERALGNLTRANTNFNTITANLTEIVTPSETSSKSSSSTRSFASLMLGRIQKDSEGRKTTLLVSVTPFGGDESLPTAKRPNDRKITVNGFSSPSKCKIGDATLADKSEITLKSVKKIDGDRITYERDETKYTPGLEKIVDMPLITSNNLISVIQRNESAASNEASPEKLGENSLENEFNLESMKPNDKKIGAIPRSPAIKKPEIEKAKISLESTQTPGRGEYEFVARIIKRSPEASRRTEKKNSCSEKAGIELTLSPLSKDDAEEPVEGERSSMIRGKDVNKITVTAADTGRKIINENSSPLESRKVEGEATTTTEKKFSFEESRESAGEPDGKADEEEITEPPALPRSPPPIELRPPLQGETSNKAPLMAMEPRASFLHGAVNTEQKVKPIVPQKPGNYSSKNSVTLDGGASYKTKNDCPLSASTVQSRLVQGTEMARDKLEETRTTSMEDQTRIIPDSTLRDSDWQANETSLEASSAPSKLQPPSYKTKLPPPSSGADHRPDCAEESLLGEDEILGLRSSTPESIRSPNKRRMAPRPPGGDPPNSEEPSSASFLFARNPGANFKSDSPVVREKEKRERASSCSPKFRKAVSEIPDPTSVAQVPDSASRRVISLSQDSLTSGQEAREEKKRGRSRFSLKRFLRMGSRKDVDMMSGGRASNARTDEIPSTPQPKPRLEIIHPLELDGAAVEVLGNDRIGRSTEDQPDSCGFRNDAGRTTRAGPPCTSGAQHAAVRPGKPPPPPRNQSLEDWSRLDPANKPVRPPPPRVETKQLPPRSSDKSSSKSSSWQPTTSTTSDSIYANLAAEDVTGEVRSSLAPSKPQRTASMRDQATSQPVLKKHGSSTLALNQDYETLAVGTPATSDSLTSNDSHVYECLSSSPECDSNLELRHGSGSHLTCKRKSDSNAMEAAVEFKFHHQPFVRSTSLPYCGSETESELYASYSFYTGDEGPEEDQDWRNKDDELRISRLRQRRGRSIVHRSLEDNYGAVVVANHEALAQFLEQLNQIPQAPMALRGLKNTNPRVNHFSIDTNTSITVGRRIFYSATWNEQNVTLCIAFDLATHVSRKEFYLAPIIEFMDNVSKEITDKACLPGNKGVEATISVLPRLQVNTIQSFGATTKDMHDEGTIREASFVLLQFVNALKSLQARGIEESARSLSNVVLCREDKDACYKLYLLQGLNVDTNEERDEASVSLCRCALVALQQLNLTSRLPLIQDLLMREKAVTLSQVKSVLEFSLWGPADVTLGGPREREVTLQRWLDLERANVLHALVRTRTPLTVTDEYQLLFLVRTSAKIMSEASLLLDEQRNRLARVH